MFFISTNYGRSTTVTRSDAAYALTTSGFIHTLINLHTGSLPDWRLRSLGGICVSFLHAPTG